MKPDDDPTRHDGELWLRTARALENGDFTALDDLLRERGASVLDLLETNGEAADLMAEALTWCCFTGRAAEARSLLAKGVDPAAGIKTGLSALHWAVNRGQIETTRLLLEHGAPLEKLNMYGGTVLSCALYSSIYEPRPEHGEIIEMLIDAGALIQPAAVEWWDNEMGESDHSRERIAKALRR